MIILLYHVNYMYNYMYSASISHRIYIVITYCIVLNCLGCKTIFNSSFLKKSEWLITKICWLCLGFVTPRPCKLCIYYIHVMTTDSK